MKGLIEVALVMLLALSGGAYGQYIGSSRPLDAQLTLDSLAVKLDTSRFTADSLRLDSLASASAVRDSDLHTRIDSVRDNPAAGGGGGTLKWWDLSIGAADDDIGYDWEISNPADSTEFTDSLQLFVDSLAALAASSEDSTAIGLIGPGYWIVADTVFGPYTGSNDYVRIYIIGVKGRERATELAFSAHTFGG